MKAVDDERREAAALKALFLETLERPPEERHAHLASRCTDERLRGLAADLLRAHASSETAAHRLAEFEAEPTPASAETIGPYQLFERIGEGRTGVVYRARHRDGGHTVALKVLRSHCHALDELRFEREWQILGQLEHPGIARLFDAGAVQSSAERHLYLAMELVDGTDVITFADAAGLDLDARLALLARIADALQAAHLRGVIHRDVKPANVLVDRDGAPKVVDFGVARMVDRRGDDDATFTSDGDVLGTVGFMSPEQRSGDSAAADQRADVYALGALGFELVTGSRPYDLRGRSLIESLRQMREAEPRRVRDVLPSAPRDLELVIATAMHTDPAARYQSAGRFADDLRRVSAHEPIAAHPPSVAYRARKFVRRHRVRLAGAAAGVALVAALGLVALDAARARSAARTTKSEASQRLLFSEYRLDDHVAHSTASPAEFLADVEAWLARASDDQGRPGPPIDATAFRKDALEREGWILTMNGNALGPEYLRTAHEMVLAQEGVWDDATFRAHAVRTANLYGDALCAVGDGRRDGADLARANLPRCATLEDRLRLEMNIAESLAASGDLADALQAFESIERRLATLPNADVHPDVGEVLANRARTLLRLGRAAEARAVAREALAFQRRAQGDGNPATQRARMLAAWATLANGDAERAVGELAAVAAVFEDDPMAYFADLLDARLLLGLAHRALGHADRAAELLATVADIVTATLPPGNWRREMVLAANR